MKKILNIPNLYVLLWALYYTQGMFIAQGSLVSRVVLVLFLSISLYYAYLTYSKYNINTYLKALGLILIMFTFYGVIGMLSGVSFDYLKLIYLSLLPTYPFFVWTKKGDITPQRVRLITIVMVGVVLFQYAAYESFIEENYTDTENSVINIAYEVLALLPLIFFWDRRPTVQYIMLGIILAIVLSTVKRGAIIIAVICAIYFLRYTSREAKNKKKWYVWLLVIVFIIAGSRYVINFYSNSSYAQMRLEQTMGGDSSGRDWIFSKCWEIFINSNVFNMFFGHGAWGTLKMMRILAHNDWLEILVNQGVMGVFLYLYYWKSYYKTFKYARNSRSKVVIGITLIIYFFATFFSMSYSAMTLPANLALGYGLAAMDIDNDL